MAEFQSAAAVVMVRPSVLFSDSETAATNSFQMRPQSSRGDETTQAQLEFEGVASALAREGIEVIVIDPPAGAELPDAIFPNNWFSTHGNGTVVVYAMSTPRRRLERQPQLFDRLQRDRGFAVREVIDLSMLERSGVFVEGTGSLVFDHLHRRAYAALSPRTTAEGVRAACNALGFESCCFEATDPAGTAIYHTNVMLSIGSTLAVACLDSIRNDTDRRRVADQLEADGKRLMTITLEQMGEFAANVLELRGSAGPVLAISRRAWKSLDREQRRVLEEELQICPVAVDVIERLGGGGVRCMLAEVHLPPLQRRL